MTCTKQEKLPPLTLLICSSVCLLFCYSRALRPTWLYRKTAPTYSVNRFIRSSVILLFSGSPAYMALPKNCPPLTLFIGSSVPLLFCFSGAFRRTLNPDHKLTVHPLSQPTNSPQ